jgi:hypothetical protein
MVFKERLLGGIAELVIHHYKVIVVIGAVVRS